MTFAFLLRGNFCFAVYFVTKKRGVSKAHVGQIKTFDKLEKLGCEYYESEVRRVEGIHPRGAELRGGVLSQH